MKFLFADMMTSIITVNCQLVIVMIMLNHQFVLSCQLCAFKNVHPCVCFMFLAGGQLRNWFRSYWSHYGCQVDILLSIKEMNTEYFKLILKAEEKNNMLLVVQGNALKRKSEEKEGHLGQLKKRMLELQEKKQTMH